MRASPPDDRSLVDHPIVNHFATEVKNEADACPCDDCDPCDYENGA